MNNGVVGARRLLERVGVVPAGLAALVAFILRASQTWSFGTFSIAHLPWGLPGIIASATGFGVAFCCEILGSAGMGKWWSLYQQALLIEARKGMNRAEKVSQGKALMAKSWLNLAFGIVGYGASIFAGVAFAFTVGSADLLTDIATMFIATAAICYIFVFWEPEHEDPLAPVMNTALDGVARTMSNIADAIAEGTHSPRQVVALQRALVQGGQSQHAAMIEPLIEQPEDIEWIPLAHVRRLIGRDDTAGQRYVSRTVAQARELDTEGIRQRENGRGWEISAKRFGELFKDDIERVAKDAEVQRAAAMRWFREAQDAKAMQAADSQRTASGHGTAVPGLQFQPAVHVSGQPADIERTITL